MLKLDMDLYSESTPAMNAYGFILGVAIGYDTFGVTGGIAGGTSAAIGIAAANVLNQHINGNHDIPDEL